MHDESTEKLRAAVRDIPDFPKPGILFKDITPILADRELLRLAIDGLSEAAGDAAIDKIVGIDARGFIFGAAVADRLNAGFIPVRKAGKLPYATLGCSYALEYGEANIEIHEDAIHEGENVLLIDDLLATGGTAAAAINLLNRLKANIIGFSVLIELEFLNGRAALPKGLRVHSLLSY